MYLREGARGVRLPCPVDARPRPLVTWTKDGQLVSVGFKDPSTPGPVHRRGVLFFDRVRKSDAGMYVCSAVNGFGKLRVPIQIIVTSK